MDIGAPYHRAPERSLSGSVPAPRAPGGPDCECGNVRFEVAIDPSAKASDNVEEEDPEVVHSDDHDNREVGRVPRRFPSRRARPGDTGA